MILSALGIPLIFIDLFASRHARDWKSFDNDRLDICIDDQTICGPVRDGVFGLAQPEVVPLSAIDLSRSRYNYAFGSYLALNDGRILVVSTLAHPARNIRRVFEAIAERTQIPS